MDKGVTALPFSNCKCGFLGVGWGVGCLCADFKKGAEIIRLIIFLGWGKEWEPQADFKKGVEIM